MEDPILHPNGLVVRTSDRGEGPVFDRFFAGYDRAFVLPDEKEDIEGFRACLALNHGAEHVRLTAEYGPFREICLIADDAEDVPVGGANLIAAALDGPGFDPIVTVNLNYIYIEPESRGHGHLRRLAAVAADIAGTMLNSPAPPLMFIEQNDPFRMSAQAYAHDTAATGIDQLDRLRIWARLGARIVDIDYVQPALSAGKEHDDALVYALLGGREAPLSAALVAAHLRRFFGISVLKGAPLDGDRVASALLSALAARGGEIALLDPRPLLAHIKGRDDAAAALGAEPTSVRDAIGRFAA